MDSIKGKRLLKIMWVADDESAVFSMVDGSQESVSKEDREFIDEALGLASWKIQFGKHYQAWVNEDDAMIYDLRHPINSEMLENIKRVNALDGIGFRLFYWYDGDPTDTTRPAWEDSPLSGEKLYDLGPDYFHANRLISLEDSLTFPAVVNLLN